MGINKLNRKSRIILIISLISIVVLSLGGLGGFGIMSKIVKDKGKRHYLRGFPGSGSARYHPIRPSEG